MKTIKFILFVLLCSLISINANAQGLKSFKLPNGLSVYIWEDDNATDAFGMVAVNVGAKEDPEEYTGLAHYLEHMMFKGTEKIGALDWAKEKPVYEKIIAKYDEMAETVDPVRKAAISKEINQLTQEAALCNFSTEFSGLTQSYGGEDLNAYTSFDYTIYLNSFPPGDVYKWLELNSERLINPVFRSFQTELETVYEEYNRAQDQQARRESEFVMGNIFAGHPYARSVLGLPEHLKNPRLSKLIAFYHDWYVPQNMALILTGKVKTNEIVSLIREKFGRLENRPLPERKQYPETPLKGRKKLSAKISRYPSVSLIYKGIPTSSEDDIALNICTSILSNSSKTGLIDKLVLNGDLMNVNASSLSLKDRGIIQIVAVPVYDRNQGRFESLGSVEKMLLTELKKLKEGQFDDWLIQSIKNKMIREHERDIEKNLNKANAIADAILSGKDLSYVLQYSEKVAEITTGQIKEVAKKYFGDDFFAFYLEEGKPAKGKELEKPEYESIKPVRGAESDYAKTFKLLPVKFVENFADMNSVEVRQINDRSKLYYTKNNENDIFTLTLKFGVGTQKMPKLQLAASLMNNAGVMGQLDAQEVKQEFSNLGASCSYRVDDSYLYVVLTGFEANLESSCNLLTRQVLLPKLDEKQMNQLQGSVVQSRILEKKMNESLSAAMQEYLFYGDKSDFIDRLPLEEINNLTVSNLTGEFQRATDYEAEIHYVGSLPIDQVYDILGKNLPLKQGEKESTSPEIKDNVNYTENTIFFLPNSDAKQSTITFFIGGSEYKKEIDPYANAFNQYFGYGGFSSIVLQEIREYRSMAYSAGGYFYSPVLEGKKTYFMGALGTQSDKTIDAIDIFMDLLTNMPQYPDRMDNIKNYLKQTASVEKPHFRDASQIFQGWKQRGYTQSPAATNFQTYDNMTFDDIVKFYNENVKGRPVAIGIVGNPKSIDTKALEKYGKVVKLSPSKVFSGK
ncbi:MAG: insulinase family protein [Dysgonamonadaceae bacterium]|jgi:predicted Zn-dependent peptidase|nr:insulinase family protein [Dysgonamonadaceae bacterium]